MQPMTNVINSFIFFLVADSDEALCLWLLVHLRQIKLGGEEKRE